jgi:hypothetical protein
MIRILLAVFAVVALTIATIRLVRDPSASRDWHPQQRTVPSISVRGDLVEIRGVRDFGYRGESDFEARYVDRTYDLEKLDAADYVVSRFGGVPGLAHAFLTFGFGGERVAISVEARKERGETYSPLRGLLNEYELMYVIGSERDLIGVRTHVWKEAVTLYPVRATPDQLRRMFLEMVTRAEKLRGEPEFYDTLFNSCNSNIVHHVDTIAPGSIGFDPRTILPGFADTVAYELGLIDSPLPLETIRTTHRIDLHAARLPLDEHFSRNIRRHLPAR